MKRHRVAQRLRLSGGQCARRVVPSARFAGLGNPRADSPVVTILRAIGGRISRRHRRCERLLPRSETRTASAPCRRRSRRMGPRAHRRGFLTASGVTPVSTHFRGDSIVPLLDKLLGVGQRCSTADGAEHLPVRVAEQVVDNTPCGSLDKSNARNWAEQLTISDEVKPARKANRAVACAHATTASDSTIAGGPSRELDLFTWCIAYGRAGRVAQRILSSAAAAVRSPGVVRCKRGP